LDTEKGGETIEGSWRPSREQLRSFSPSKKVARKHSRHCENIRKELAKHFAALGSVPGQYDCRKSSSESFTLYVPE
jgi:hypothetical protein